MNSLKIDVVKPINFRFIFGLSCRLIFSIFTVYFSSKFPNSAEEIPRKRTKNPSEDVTPSDQQLEIADQRNPDDENVDFDAGAEQGYFKFI